MPQRVEHTVSTQDNEEIARRIFEEIWQNRNYDAIDELIDEDYVIHDPSMPEGDWPRGPEGVREMAEIGAEMIDGPLELEQVIPAGEYVVSRWKQTGPFVGEMGRIDPTDEEVTITGMEIDRFEDGKLAETWQEVNMIDLLIKTGVVPEDIFTPDGRGRLSDAGREAGPGGSN